MRLVQPPNTAKYEVASSDTLARIALRYNTTPTELSRLNHLSSSLLYPGQTLFVPDKSENGKETKDEEHVALLENTNTKVIPINESPKKNNPSLELERSFSPDKHLDQLLTTESLHTSDDEISRKYLKLKSKYVTDGQGVVSGVLLVTPQTTMFNPCVSDHLVMERGREMYMVRLPLRAISRIILFEDIAAMVVGDMSKQYIPKVSFIDYASEHHISPKPGMIVCQETGEKYALHTNFEKGTINVQPNDTDLTLALENLTIDQLQTGKFTTREQKDNDNEYNDDTCTDQGICSISDQHSSNSNSTVTDITLLQTTDVPSLNNNECTSCQNFSEFMEDSQFSSTPKHKTLQDIHVDTNDMTKDDMTKEMTDSRTSDITICNAADSIILKHTWDPLSDFDTELSKLTEDIDDAVTTIVPEDSTGTIKTITDSIVNDDKQETRTDCTALATEEDITQHISPKKVIGEKNVNFPDFPIKNISENTKPCTVDASNERLKDDGDLIVGRMIENYFDNTTDTTADNSADINEIYNNIVNDNSEIDTKSNVVVKSKVSPVCDVSKDSGISEVESTISSNESKDYIRSTSIEAKDSFGNTSQLRKSSLSNEARQWLGKHGVKLSTSMEEGYGTIEDTSESEMKIAVDMATPRPASKVDDPLMYVSIKIHKNYWCPIRAKQNQIMGVPPNRDQKRREHWFAIPRERVDQFYNFLLYWAPDVYGEDHESECSTPSSDYETSNEKLNPSEDGIMRKGKSGSQHSISSSTRSLTEDEIPELHSESQILSKKQIHLLTRKLPSRTVGHSWELVYSTTIHGISLSTLYRNFHGYDTPVLIVVKDEKQKVFGAFLSEVPKVSEGFYGTGESMLYSFNGDTTIKSYSWTGENNFFMKGSKTSLAIGGGDGIFGLWIDEDLYRGSSHTCKTFANDTLSHSEDFICCGFEAWGFV